jgi:hypothetical protein
MNLSSGGATIGLVAEVTGLTGNTGTRSGSELETEVSGLKNDIKGTS